MHAVLGPFGSAYPNPELIVFRYTPSILINNRWIVFIIFVLPTGFEPVIFAVERNRGYKPLKVFIITPANCLDVALHL